MHLIVSIQNFVHRQGLLNDQFELRVSEAYLPGGQTIALLGESGCGKTTLCMMIGLLIRCRVPESRHSHARFSFDFAARTTRPRIQFDLCDSESRTVADDTLRQQLRRSKIGFCPQSLDLLWDLTVVENIEIPLCLCGWRSSERQQRIRETLVWLFGERWEQLKNKRVSTLSGGEKQRVALGRAMIHKPELLIIDEPTASLNPRLARHSLELVTKSARDEGTTVVMVTHDEGLAYEFADFIIHLESVVPEQAAPDQPAAFGQISRYERRVVSAAALETPAQSSEWVPTTARWQRVSAASDAIVATETDMKGSDHEYAHA